MAVLAGPGVASARLSWTGPVATDTAGTGPALTAVACPSASECVAIDAAGGAVKFAPASPAPEEPAIVDGAGVTGLACVSTSQCVAVDVNGGEVTFDPSAPGSAVGTVIDPGQILYAVSCAPGAATCTAVDGAGYEVTFSPSAPGGSGGINSHQVDHSGALTAVSCPPQAGATTTMCAAVDSAGTVIQFDPANGSTLSQSSLGGSGGTAPTLTAVACGDISTCVALDASGTATTESPSGTRSAIVDQGHAVIGADCVTAGQCTVVDNAGAEVTFAPGASGTRTPIDGQNQLTSVSCPTLTLCVAVDVAGHALAFDPQSPRPVTGALIDRVPSLTAVACPATTQCTGGDSSGGEVTFDPSAARGASSAVIDPGKLIYGIACPTQAQCTAVDAHGAEVTFNPSSTVAPAPVALVHNHPLLAIACPASTQCTAVDDDQYAVTFNPQAPTTGRYAVLGTPAAVSLTGIACPSVVQCTAVDGSGQQVTFNPQSPGTPTPTTVLADGAVGVSCPSTGQCTAVGISGERATFDPASPATVDQTVLSTGRMAAVSCPSSTFCLAADASGRALEFDPHGAGATAVSGVGAGAPLTAVACASAGVCAAVDSANRAFLGTGAVPAAPGASGSPRIVGRARQGSLLREVHGRWSGEPTAYALQWERCGRGGVCRPIAGATGQSYRVGGLDVGDTIRVWEIASDPGGAGTAQVSRRTAVVVGLPGAPRFAAVALTGLKQRRPRLSLTVIADHWGPLLRQVEIVLPRGLAVVRRTAITVEHGDRELLSQRGRAVTIRLPRAVSRLRVVIASPGLTASAGTVRAARRRVVRPLLLTGVASWSGHPKLHFSCSFRRKS